MSILPRWPIAFIAILLTLFSWLTLTRAKAGTFSYRGKIYLIDRNGLALGSSSELSRPEDNTFGPYSIIRAFDKSLKTCWSEGAMDSGIGQYIWFSLPEGTEVLRIANGYQKTRRLFLANNRLKRIAASLFAGFSIDGEVTERFLPYYIYKIADTKFINIKDKPGYQDVPFEINWKEIIKHKKSLLDRFRRKHPSIAPNRIRQVYLVKMTINKVFRGSRYNDTCISELVPVVTRYSKGKILRIYTNDTEDTIFMDTIHAKRIILDRDPSSVFQIISTSPDNQWAIVIKMPAHPGPSRVETSYFLYNTFLNSRLPSQSLGRHVGELYDFDSHNGIIFLNYLNLETMDVDQLDIDSIKQLFIKPRLQGHQKDNKTKGGSE